MHRSKWIIGLGAVILGAALVTAQQQSGSGSGQSGTSASQQQAATPRRNSGRLTRPWNKMSDLSDEQKTKIIAIHRKALDEIDAIRAKERQDIVALLSEDQKKQLATLDAQPRARRGSTTRPAAGGAGN